MAENTWVSLFHCFFSQMAQKNGLKMAKKMVYTIPIIPRIKMMNSYNQDHPSKQVFFSSFTQFFLETLQFLEANGVRSPKFIGFFDEGLGSDLFVGLDHPTATGPLW